MAALDELKIILRESHVPYFSDEELQYYLGKNRGDINSTAYECLLVKSEDTSLSISGLSVADSSAYFRRLADRYRPRTTKILGVD